MLTKKEIKAAKQFWDWFEKNELALQFIPDMEREQADTIIGQMESQFYQISEGLDITIGESMMNNGRLRAVVTTGGNVKYFDKAKALVKLATPNPKWDFHALEPPLPLKTCLRIVFDGKILDAGDLWVQIGSDEKEPNYMGIHVASQLFGIMEDELIENLQHLIAQLVFKVIGEESWAMNIQHFEVGDLPLDPEGEGMFPLYDLPFHIAEYRKKWVSPQQ